MKHTLRFLTVLFVAVAGILNMNQLHAQIINTIAGNSTAGYSGDGGAATAAEVALPIGIAVDASGNVYIADHNNQRIRKINTSGIISTYAGTGTGGYSGDGGAATAAEISYPDGITLDASGNLYITDYGNNRIRKINTSGIISTVAGNGTAGFSGDGGAAVYAELNEPSDVAVDAAGNIYIADWNNYRIRKVNTSGIISTIAGNSTSGYSGDGGAATAAEFVSPNGVSVDGSGNIYISDSYGYRVRKINTSGVINTIAGNGSDGYSGDGGAATAAELSRPWDVVIDGSGNIYISDANNARIRKVNTSGIISTIVGNGTAGSSGDGGAATAAEINALSIALDASNNIYMSDYGNNRIRKVTETPTYCTPSFLEASYACSTYGMAIARFHLNGASGTSIFDSAACTGSGYQLRGLSCNLVEGTSYLATVVPGGSTYSMTNQVWIDFNNDGTFQTSETVGGRTSYTGSTTDTLTMPYTVPAGTHRMRILQTYDYGTSYPSLNPCETTYEYGEARDYTVDFGGGSPTVTASPDSLNFGMVAVGSCSSVESTSISGVYLTPASGTITVTAPTGYKICSTYGGTYVSSYTIAYTSGTLASSNIYIELCPASATTYCGCVNITGGGLSSSYCISTCGTGESPCSGTPTAGTATASPSTGGATTAFTLSLAGYTSGVTGISFQWQSAPSSGGTYTNISGATNPTYNFTGITANECYRCNVTCATYGYSAASTTSCVTYASGSSSCVIITTIVGNGTSGYSGDGGPATAAEINGATIVNFDPSGNMYIADYSNNRIRKVSTSGIITTVAGNGSASTSGDGGAATAAAIDMPSFVTIYSGSMYIAEYYGHRIRKVTSAGIISTVAGDGTGGFSGDGGEAVYAELYYPTSIAFDASGNMYIADEANNRIRKVNDSGIITTFAGGGSSLGDGGAAVSASLDRPGGVALDASGNVYIADALDNRIRKVNTSGIISTYAGNGTAGYTGDGGEATAAELNHPLRLILDASGNLYFGDQENNRTREITASGIISTIAGDGTAGFSGDGGPATAAETNGNQGVAIDASGNIYIADVANYRIRKIGPGTTATVSAISGPSTVCVGAAISLTDSISGGSWSSSNTAIATVSGDGTVHGVTAGTVTISYTKTASCGSAVATKSITVSAGPATPAGISGPSSVCVGSAITLTDGTSGGAWSSSASSIASISSTGVVTGVSAGYVTITYTITNSCGSAYATTSISVGTSPSAGTISGSTVVCFSAGATYTDGVSGGSWTLSTYSVATISGAGMLIPVALGYDTVIYTVASSCGTAQARLPIVIVSSPSAPAAISGASAVCTGNTTTLTDATSGGVWSSSNTSVATVSSTGTVGGVSAGTTTISYTVSGSCGSASATKSITVSAGPSVSAISGTTTVCTGLTTTLSDGTTSGVWSSSNSSIASVNTSGVVTGVSAGSANISYTVTNSCGSSSVSIAVTVNSVPSVGAISGSSALCTGASTTLSDATSGGAWTSTATSVASVDAAGNVYGVSGGTTTISYTLTNTCGSAAATKVITVTATPTAGTISGLSTVCTGVTTTLTDGTSGGTWSSSNSSVATINSGGVAGGVTAGSVTITYSVTTSCGTAIATKALTVNASPNAGSITGPTTVCPGASITLTDASSGGTWSSSAPSVATVSSGVVTGVAAGSVILSYSVTGSCGTAVATFAVTVNPLPSAGTISGPSIVCAGSTITLTDAVSGGTWSSSNTAEATVSSSGVVTGISAGTVSISYAVTNSCGTAVAGNVISVGSLPSAGTITGASVVCTGSSITLTDAVSGGSWSCSNASLATISSAGVLTGVSAGSVTVSYTVSSTCATAIATSTITVSTSASAGTISGLASVCTGANITLTSSGTAGGTWSSSSTAKATVSAGVVHGVAAGSVTISYSVTSGCGTVVATKSITVNATPSVTAITGASSVCVGTSSTYTDATSGGGWISSNTSIATVNASGVVTGISAGTATLTYFVTNTCGTATTTKSITVNSLSAGVISGASTVAVGAATTLTNSISGGTWSSVSTSIATITSGGTVTGVAVGTDTIIYSVTNVCGTATATKVISVTAHRDELPGNTVGTGENVNINLYPNPNSGAFTVEITGNKDVATIMVTDITGRVLIMNTSNEKTIYFDMSKYAVGTYLVKVTVDGQEFSRKVMIN